MHEGLGHVKTNILIGRRLPVLNIVRVWNAIGLVIPQTQTIHHRLTLTVIVSIIFSASLPH